MAVGRQGDVHRRAQKRACVAGVSALRRTEGRIASFLSEAAAQMIHVQNSDCREGDGHGTPDAPPKDHRLGSRPLSETLPPPAGIAVRQRLTSTRTWVGRSSRKPSVGGREVRFDRIGEPMLLAESGEVEAFSMKRKAISADARSRTNAAVQGQLSSGPTLDRHEPARKTRPLPWPSWRSPPVTPR